MYPVIEANRKHESLLFIDIKWRRVVRFLLSGDISCDTHWGPQSRVEQYEYSVESGTISGYEH